MHVAPTLLARALARARADWLSGDPDAWARYTAGLARLEQHYQQKEANETRHAGDRRAAQARPGDRPAARF